LTQFIPTAEPFFFPGGKTGCLLAHGFGGTPKEMRWMGEYLNQQGYTVLGIRLTGHATRPEDMARFHYTDWLASVEDGWHLLSGITDQIFLVGLSMGGVLSLLMSTRLPVAGTVVMSTPYKLPDDPRLKFAKALSLFVPFLAKPPRSDDPGTGYFDQSLWDYHVSYPVNPLRSIAELLLLLAEMRAALPQLKTPVLLIHSKDDTYVVKESMPLIYEHLGAVDKTMLWIEGSGHVVTEEPPRWQVYQAAHDFIQRVSKSAQPSGDGK
jgi:carboxylesterase